MKPLSRSVFTIIATFFLSTSAIAESSGEHSADWVSPQAIVAALYETVSLEPGETGDWDRFRELFADGAQLVMALQGSRMSGLLATDVEGLISQSEAAYAATGFIESELEQRVESFGQMASVYSSFEVRLKASDPAPMMRGLNHFQLLNDGERWYIVSNVSVIENDRWQLPADFALAAK